MCLAIRVIKSGMGCLARNIEVSGKETILASRGVWNALRSYFHQPLLCVVDRQIIPRDTLKCPEAGFLGCSSIGSIRESVKQGVIREKHLANICANPTGRRQGWYSVGEAYLVRSTGNLVVDIRRGLCCMDV